jgi:two-component system response regulator AlgR
VLEPSATNGEEALALIDSLKPDVVLLDIRMPGLDGLQVAARLCEREAPPAVVFCTGDDEYGAEAFKDSTVSHVAKPSPRPCATPAQGRAQPGPTGGTDPACREGGGPRSISAPAPAKASS